MNKIRIFFNKNETLMFYQDEEEVPFSTSYENLTKGIDIFFQRNSKEFELHYLKDTKGYILEEDVLSTDILLDYDIDNIKEWNKKGGIGILLITKKSSTLHTKDFTRTLNIGLCGELISYQLQYLILSTLNVINGLQNNS